MCGQPLHTSLELCQWWHRRRHWDKRVSVTSAELETEMAMDVGEKADTETVLVRKWLEIITLEC